MILTKIHFDSFKSLVNENIEITDNCIGIVGINESGKSNILQAIRVLQEKDILSKKFAPKINKNRNPKLQFDFNLDKSEQEETLKLLNDWLKSNSLIRNEITSFNFKVQYNIEYDIESEKEKRGFKIISTKSLGKDLLILKKEHFYDDYKIFHEDNYTPTQQALIINKVDIDNSIKAIEDINSDLKEILILIDSFEQEKVKLLDKFKKGVLTNEEVNAKLEPIENHLTQLISQKNETELKLSQFNISENRKLLDNEYQTLTKEIKQAKERETKYRISINTLKLIENPSTPQKARLTKANNNLDTVVKLINTKELKLLEVDKQISNIEIPLKERYSDNFENLNYYFSRIIDEYLQNQIPKIVYWNHSSDFILKSETLFSEIISKNNISEISRPLMNVFRVGLNIYDIDKLKKVIKEIQSDGDQRSKLRDRLNKNINNHIRKIWEDYDQEVLISLERDQIRIQFYDPEFDDKSYFAMAEKSQGAQTFLSFLMTIGAEAAKGVLKNTILLLDEPEIHLHPSGVRYMLQELIKISEKDNIVIYATHSIFMIDRNNYKRHVYLKKIKERTSINPSTDGRIGFFMQEEVLHKAINIDLSKDFKSSNVFNFVFEGDGDVELFNHLYKLIESPPFAIKNTSFYQGGKCSDIKKYFTNYPIQLGSKWIFILDSDDAAKPLKKFIEGRYKDYLNKDIFLYQYKNKDKGDEVELEDLLPNDFIINVFNKTFELTNIDKNGIKLNNIINKNTSYVIYSEEIFESLDLEEDKKELFKSTFKRLLNDNIKQSIIELDTLEKFNAKFPVFSAWATGSIESIKKTKNN